jgi:excisionase family DNA binding protein
MVTVSAERATGPTERDARGGAPLDRQAYSVEEFARAVGLSRASAFRAVARGDVQAVRIGKRIVIPKSAIERLLNGAG